MASHMRILVIEDDRDLAYLYKSFLEEEGHEVLLARNAADVAKLVQKHPDLVLLDLMLPGVDGYTILRHIRADRSTRDTPVVVVSATVPPGRQSLPGANALVRKPFEFVDLMRTIDGVSHHLHRAH